METPINPKFRRKKTGFPTKIWLPLVPISLCFFVVGNFNGSSKTKNTTAPASPNNSVLPNGTKPLSVLFKGGSDSVVAQTTGHAEGTRTVNGGKTRAYYGHVDPGNGAWNLGTFSYQHGAASPEAADEAQLKILKKQADAIVKKAAAKGMKLTTLQALGGIDLYTQAPKAVVGKDGYLDNLKVQIDKAKKNPKIGSNDIVVEARVESYIDPNTKTWDAPGLGNNEARIRFDQARRIQAIESALAASGHSKDEKVSPSSLRVVATALYQKTKESNTPSSSLFYPDPPQDDQPQSSGKVISFYDTP